MYREQHSNTMDHIWHEQRKCMRTVHSQLSQLGTDRDTPVEIVAETTKEETYRLTDVYLPPFVMFSEYGTKSNAEIKIRNQHRMYNAECFQRMNNCQHAALILNVLELSMEKMILSQCDLIWENYIAAAYNSVYSTDTLPNTDVTTMNKSQFVPAQFSSFLFTQTGNGTQSLYACNKRSDRCRMKEISWDSNGEIVIKIQKPRHCKRKLTVNLLEAGEKRPKKALNINTYMDFPKAFMELDERTNLGVSNKYFSDFINSSDKRVEIPQGTTTETEDHCSLENLRPEIEAYRESNTMISTLSYFNAQQKCNTRDGCKMCDGGGSMGPVLKDLALSCFSFGDIAEVVSGTFIPQTDSYVDYIVPCSSLQQKGHCKTQVDSDESLCLTNTTDSNINQHVILSLHPHIPTSNVIFSDVNFKEPGEPQGQKCLNWVACEESMTQNKSAISTNILTSTPKWNSLQKMDLSFPYIDKENCHFGNNDESFLSTEETFSARLNYPRKLEKQHFLLNINFSILAASLLGTPKNDFLFLHSNGLQSTSKIDSSHEMAYRSCMSSFKREGINLEQTEVEVLLSTQNINKRTGSAHLDYTIALKNEDFCFPSHFQNGIDIQHFEQDTSGKLMDTYCPPLCSKQVSFMETFEKICLDLCLVELESNYSKETYCSFHNENGFFKSRSTLGNTAAMESKPTECKSKCPVTKQPYRHQSHTSGTEYTGGKEELMCKNTNNEIHCDIILNSKMCDTFICETGMQNVIVASKDPTVKNRADVERNEHMELHLPNKKCNLCRAPSFTNTFCSETTLNVNTKQRCEHIKEIQDKEASPSVIYTDGCSVGTPVSLENLEFGMKAQYELVLQELKLFHTIGEEKENSPKAEEGNGLEHTCITFEELSAILNESFPSNTVRGDGECQDLVKNDEYVCDKVVTQVKEQEVPQQCWSAHPAEEESLYSTDKEGDVAKTFSWTSAFKNGDPSIASHTEKEVTFSHGIVRVTPLKTRTGPLRIGLSKKAKIKQLHPYLR